MLLSYYDLPDEIVLQLKSLFFHKGITTDNLDNEILSKCFKEPRSTAELSQIVSSGRLTYEAIRIRLRTLEKKGLVYVTSKIGKTQYYSTSFNQIEIGTLGFGKIEFRGIAMTIPEFLAVLNSNLYAHRLQRSLFYSMMHLVYRLKTGDVTTPPVGIDVRETLVHLSKRFKELGDVTDQLLKMPIYGDKVEDLDKIRTLFRQMSDDFTKYFSGHLTGQYQDNQWTKEGLRMEIKPEEQLEKWNKMTIEELKEVRGS